MVQDLPLARRPRGISPGVYAGAIIRAMACCCFSLLSALFAFAAYSLARIRMYSSEGVYRGLDSQSIALVAILITFAVLTALAAWYVRPKDYGRV